MNVYGPEAPTRTAAGTYVATIATSSSDADAVSGMFDADAWLFLSRDNAARLVNHMADATFAVCAMLCLHPRAAAVATTFLYRTTNAAPLTHFDPRIVAAGCVLVAVKSQHLRLDTGSLCAAFRSVLGRGRFPYGPADVVAIELDLVTRFTDMGIDVPTSHALLLALIAPQPRAASAGSSRAGSRPAVIPLPSAAILLAWQLTGDLYRSPLPAQLLRAGYGGRSVLPVACAVLYVAAAAHKIDASQVFSHLGAPRALVVSIIAALFARYRAAPLSAARDAITALPSRAAAARFHAAALETRRRAAGRRAAGLSPASAKLTPRALQGPAPVLGIGDMFLLLDLVHVAPCEAVFRAATAQARAAQAAAAQAGLENNMRGSAPLMLPASLPLPLSKDALAAFARTVLSPSTYLTALARGLFKAPPPPPPPLAASSAVTAAVAATGPGAALATVAAPPQAPRAALLGAVPMPVLAAPQAAHARAHASTPAASLASTSALFVAPGQLLLPSAAAAWAAIADAHASVAAGSAPFAADQHRAGSTAALATGTGPGGVVAATPASGDDDGDDDGDALYAEPMRPPPLRRRDSGSDAESGGDEAGGDGGGRRGGGGHEGDNNNDDGHGSERGNEDGPTVGAVDVAGDVSVDESPLTLPPLPRVDSTGGVRSVRGEGDRHTSECGSTGGYCYGMTPNVDDRVS